MVKRETIVTWKIDRISHYILLDYLFFLVTTVKDYHNHQNQLQLRITLFLLAEMRPPTKQTTNYISSSLIKNLQVCALLVLQSKRILSPISFFYLCDNLYNIYILISKFLPVSSTPSMIKRSSIASCYNLLLKFPPMLLLDVFQDLLYTSSINTCPCPFLYL